MSSQPGTRGALHYLDHQGVAAHFSARRSSGSLVPAASAWRAGGQILVGFALNADDNAAALASTDKQEIMHPWASHFATKRRLVLRPSLEQLKSIEERMAFEHLEERDGRNDVAAAAEAVAREKCLRGIAVCT